MADAIVLLFGPIAHPNTVLRYNVTAPGTTFARTEDAAVLGTGGTTYDPQLWDSNNPSAIYNPTDDKMYFLAVKTEPGPTVTNLLVQFDPRSLTISGEMALADTSLTGCTIIGVSDRTAWIEVTNAALDPPTVKCYDTTTFIEIFDDGGALRALAGDSILSSVSCGYGQLLTPDVGGLGQLHLITVTGLTTWTDVPIASPTSNPYIEGAVYGSARRQWMSNRNTVFMPAQTFGSFSDPGGIAYFLIDLDDLSITSFNAPIGVSLGLARPFSDPFSDRVVCYSVDNGVTFVALGTGATVGFTGDNGDWYPSTTGSLGGLALASGSGVLGIVGGLGEDPTAPDAVETYNTNDSFVSPDGNVFRGSFIGIGYIECIAPRIATPPEPPVVPPRMETSIGGGGSCGVQFERLEMFHLLKSLMGSGRTLEQAMKFLEQDDVDFLEEEELLDDLPQEIPKPARQGTSPKMVDRRINLAPITKLNSLIAEFETKLQNCRTTQRREYDK